MAFSVLIKAMIHYGKQIVDKKVLTSLPIRIIVIQIECKPGKNKKHLHV